MKKVGLLILALVVALGGLGAGYAMWSDEINIEGRVGTGTVDIDVTGATSMYVWKTADHGIASGTTLPENTKAVAYAVVTYGADDADTVNFNFHNLFPLEDDCGGSYCASFYGVYNGSIPAHVNADLKAKGSDAQKLEWLWDNGYVKVEVKVNDLTVDPDSIIQLHNGDTYGVQLCITIPQDFNDNAPEGYEEDVNTQRYLSGISGGFEATITAFQWNEDNRIGAN